MVANPACPGEALAACLLRPYPVQFKWPWAAQPPAAARTLMVPL